MLGTNSYNPGGNSPVVSRAIRAAAWICLGWGGLCLIWMAYNCFGQIGTATFLKGLFYFGQNGTGRVDTASVAGGVLFPLAGIAMLRGQVWARGFALGVAVLGGYGWLRGLTGALFDSTQSPWFTGQLQGQLRLATIVIGLAVPVALAILFRGALAGTVEPRQPWSPERWPAQAPTPIAPQPGGWAPVQQPAALQAPYPAPQFGQPSAPVGQGYPQQLAGPVHNPYAPQAGSQPYGYPQPPVAQQLPPATQQVPPAAQQLAPAPALTPVPPQVFTPQPVDIDEPQTTVILGRVRPPMDRQVPQDAPPSADKRRS